MSWSHVRDNCENANFKCSFKEASSACGGPHHRMLHGAQKAAVINHQKVVIASKEVIPMLCLDPIVVKGVETSLLLDNGSTVSCITHSLADKLGLTGTWTQRLVELAGEPAKLIDTKEYKMVVKMGGKQWKLILLGLQRKTSKPEPQDVSEAYQLFPHLPCGSVDRPTHEVGLLFGVDNTALLPLGGSGINQVGNLRAM